MALRPLSAADVSLAVRTTLTTYLPAQLAATDRPLPAPTSYDQAPTADAIRRVFGSTLAVIIPGLRDAPERFSDGTYDLEWSVIVAVWHQNTDALPLLTAGGDYAAAVRQTLLDHLPANTTQVEYLTESWDLVGDGLSEQTLGMAMVEFSVRTGSQITYTPTPDTSGPVVLTTDVQLNPNP